MDKIGGKFTKITRKYIKKQSKKFLAWIQKQKIIQELKDIQEFKKFEEEMITEVFPLKIKDKISFIHKFNNKNHWNLKIKAFVPQKPFDTLEGDIFLIEGAATHNKLGVKINNHKIDYTDFWIWNTYKNDIVISSKNNFFKPKKVKSKKIILIKTIKEEKFSDILVNGIPFTEKV